MNVMDQLRKQRREVLRKLGQPVYHMPGKRERTIKAKKKARGGRDYTTADIVHDFHTKGPVLPPLARYERLLDALLGRIDWSSPVSLARPAHGHAAIVAAAAALDGEACRMSDYDPFDWMDEPQRFIERVFTSARLVLACFAVAASIALFIAHYPG